MKSDIFQFFTRIKYISLVMCALTLGVGFSGIGWANASVDTIELLMIESDNCPYCRKFDREIADIYPKTAEGKRAPLKRHKLGDTLPDKYAGLDITASTLTPTFILLENNKEVDRLPGYNSEDFFWYFLNDLFDKLQTR
ncbi:MAG: thioredoxin family protein [Granulosicoccaceae bacterium]